ncbi:hypothetical protein GCM10009838_83580 [Catenulispora subtropica]|uniref:Uncharacterized protein n=1 Tax=Catenulispora subtropica TaxID=450798 RepID=A0ABP5EQQ1_9ACTN
MDADPRMLLELPTPILSVYLAHLDQATDDPEARRLATVALLAALGATEAQTEIVEDAFAEAEPGRPARALFVGADGAHHACELPGSPVPDLVLSAGVPHLTPLLAWRQAHPAYVLALLDRAGADITVQPEQGGPSVTTTVTGPDDDGGADDPAGWSRPRYRPGADASWRDNARRAADEVAAALDCFGARILLSGGDVRAVQCFTDALPPRIRHTVTMAKIGGSRHADGAWPPRALRVAEKVAALVRERTEDLLAELSDSGGTGGTDGTGGCAVDRPSAVIRALAQGRVRTLLVSEAPDRNRTAWFGSGPAEVAVHRDELPGQDPAPRYGPLTDVAVRAAVLAGADVRILPAGTPGSPISGLAAICRD